VSADRLKASDPNHLLALILLALTPPRAVETCGDEGRIVASGAATANPTNCQVSTCQRLLGDAAYDLWRGDSLRAPQHFPASL